MPSSGQHEIIGAASLIRPILERLRFSAGFGEFSETERPDLEGLFQPWPKGGVIWGMVDQFLPDTRWQAIRHMR